MKVGALPEWTKLPTAWIESNGLRRFRWGADGIGADNAAALMILTVLANHADPESGVSSLSYSAMAEMTSLSRTKVSGGLSVLNALGLVDRADLARGSYKLANYDQKAGWAKFPAKRLYENDVVSAFRDFRLRRPSELDALKLYFLFAARRSRTTNMAHLSYPKIAEYAGVQTTAVKRAVSILAAVGLVHVERVASTTSEFAVANAYRLAHLHTRQHMGTTGRSSDALAEVY